MLVQFLGGRAAEELVFDTVTTGAANDIERATKLARAMVTQYGMSEEFGLMGLESIESQYLSGRTVMNCADMTAATVDEVVKRILKDAYQQAKDLLSHHRKAMDEIAAFLIERESITGKEFMEILHKIENPEEETEPTESKAEAAESEAIEVNTEMTENEVETEKADSKDVFPGYLDNQEYTEL